MHRWGYSLLIILSAIFASCSSKPDPPSVELAPTEVSTKDEPKTTVAEEEQPSVTPVEKKPSTTKETKQSVAELSQKTTKSEVGIVLPFVNPLEVEGDIIAAGSSSLFPLTQAMYDRFIEEGFRGVMKLDDIGTRGGLKLFCQGKSDIAIASRSIKDKEIKACAAIDRKPVEFHIGTDALVIIVNPENDFLTNVTLKELATIFTEEKWSDVNPSWPDEQIQRFSPDSDSGTLDSFIIKVLPRDAETFFNAPNTEFSDDLDDVVVGVNTKQYAIGIVNYNTYKENTDVLKILAINGIKPDAETVDDGKYTLTRPLFIYSDANIIKQKPQVEAFINFYLTNVNEEGEALGYFPVSHRTLDKAKVNFLKAMGYEAFLN